MYKIYDELKADVKKILDSSNLEYEFSYSVRFSTYRLCIRMKEITAENMQSIVDICNLGYDIYQTLDNTVKETEGNFQFNLSAKYF